MKILVAILGLMLGLASPQFGQEPQTVSADARSQVEASFAKFRDAYNARDAEGIASTMTQDAVFGRVGDWEASGGGSFSAGFQRESRPNDEHHSGDVSSRNGWSLRDCGLACWCDAFTDHDPLCAFGW
jgi:hypothetical protein